MKNTKMPLSVGIFTSTLGHRGRKDIYRIAFDDFLKKLGPGPVAEYLDVVVHIKISEGEEFIEAEIRDYYESHGASVFSSIGEWKNDDSSHADGYTADIITLLDKVETHRNEFFLWLEDDWILNFEGDLKSHLESAMDLLKEKKEILTVRINAENDKDLSKASLVERRGFPNFYVQNRDYTKFGPTFTFQPSVSRTRDLWQSYRIIQKNWEQLKNTHIELRSGFGLLPLSPSDCSFAFFDPRTINSTHIGHPPFELCAKLGPARCV
jgi:hypothetical protein